VLQTNAGSMNMLSVVLQEVALELHLHDKPDETEYFVTWANRICTLQT
jgi:hypothetical protein